MPRAFLIKKRKYGLSSSLGSAARRQKSMLVAQLHHDSDFLESKSRNSCGSGSEYSSPPPSRTPSPAPHNTSIDITAPRHHLHHHHHAAALADIYARSAAAAAAASPPPHDHLTTSATSSAAAWSHRTAAFLALPYLQHPFAALPPPYSAYRPSPYYAPYLPPHHPALSAGRRSPDTACVPPLAPYTPIQQHRHIPTAGRTWSDAGSDTGSSDATPLRIHCPPSPSPTLSVVSSGRSESPRPTFRNVVTATVVVPETVSPPPPAKRRPTPEAGSGTTAAAARYQCPDCAKSYSTYSGLSKHQQFHCAVTNRRSFCCQNCDKTYQSLGALKMHVRTHTLPCKCELCGKAFSRPWLLQGHLRTHTGEKPFQCQHCNRAFADRSNLRAHLQTHSDVKKYSCKACGKTFSRMSLLLKHDGGSCTAAASGHLSGTTSPSVDGSLPSPNVQYH